MDDLMYDTRERLQRRFCRFYLWENDLPCPPDHDEMIRENKRKLAALEMQDIRKYLIRSTILSRPKQADRENVKYSTSHRPSTSSFLVHVQYYKEEEEEEEGGRA